MVLTSTGKIAANVTMMIFDEMPCPAQMMINGASAIFGKVCSATEPGIDHALDDAELRDGSSNRGADDSSDDEPDQRLECGDEEVIDKDAGREAAI